MIFFLLVKCYFILESSERLFFTLLHTKSKWMRFHISFWTCKAFLPSSSSTFLSCYCFQNAASVRCPPYLPVDRYMCFPGFQAGKRKGRKIVNESWEREGEKNRWCVHTKHMQALTLLCNDLLHFSPLFLSPTDEEEAKTKQADPPPPSPSTPVPATKMQSTPAKRKRKKAEGTEEEDGEKLAADDSLTSTKNRRKKVMTPSER